MQTIHNKNKKQKKTNPSTCCLGLTFFCLSTDDNFFQNEQLTFVLEKKRSTQTSLLFSNKLCVKIFTSCCLLQIKLNKTQHNQYYVFVNARHDYSVEYPFELTTLLHKEKKRSTQTLFALLRILCVKIFTSCCLLQL